MENQLKNSDIKNFIFAGNATFTLVNTLTKNRFTYKVRKSKENDIFFVSVLTGSDNVSNYTFIGFIKNNKFFHSKKSRISIDSVSFKAFNWFFHYIDSIPAIIDVLHEGKCGRCGRKLTTPESIKRGLGPECSNMVK
jgi:hypothetical protein